MYLFNRNEAGRLLADILQPKYLNKKCLVMALGPGGVIVGQEIAKRLKCEITLLLLKEIELPGTDHVQIGTLDQSGGFTYNNMYSTGQIEEFVQEYYQYIEAEKLNKIHAINELMGRDGIMEREQLNDHDIILVTDGTQNGASFESAMEYLKPVRTPRVVAAVPFSSVPAIDRLHILVDDLNVLDVKENYINTNHYYEDNYIPGKDEIDKIMGHIDAGDPLQA